MTMAVENRGRLALVAVALAVAGLVVAVTATWGPSPNPAAAASHREAPLISLDPPADITDVFMFRSYETGRSDRTVLLMDVMNEEPSAAPNYWNFDPNVVYAFHLDTDKDGKADDVSFEFRFKTEFRGTVKDLGLPLAYVAVPPITALDGPGSEGIGLRQKYTVTMVHDDERTKLASGLIAVPSNVGPRTMPNYAALAAQGIYDDLPGDIRVFAGQRQDPFYIDLGAVFDTLNIRRGASPLLTATEDANDNNNFFAVDHLAGFNVHTIALEVPTMMLSGMHGSNVIGGYASTSRPRISVRGDDDDDDDDSRYTQVQRLANPLINETIIGTADKDRWNALRPQKERRFLDYYQNPRLALALQLVFGVPAATSGRDDLVNLLLKYQPSDRRLSELLRLNVTVPPTLLPAQKRMTVLASPADPAGWPNGRRPKDDVLDIAVRVVGGPNYIAGRAGDGVNTDDAALPDKFPFLATPSDGRGRVHDNP